MTPLGRWALAAAISLVALAGLTVLVVLVALAVQPPAWLQVAIGLILVAGAVGLAWLLARALKKE